MARPWTQHELEMLRSNWRNVPASELAAMLPSRTWTQIYSKAWHLGLKTGARDGFESIEAAAARSGYARRSLQSLMRRQNVPVDHTYAISIAKESARVYVRRDDVDRAVAIDLQAESIAQAAPRLHVDRLTFARFVRSKGYSVSRKREAKFPPELLDELAREYKAINEAKLRAHAATLTRTNRIRREERLRAA